MIKQLKGKSKKVVVIMIVILFSIVGFQGCIDNYYDDPQTYHYSFEKNMQGWNASGIDLDNPPIIWSINRSNNISYDGNHSVQLFLNNLNDAGKIWIEKEFGVNQNTFYKINVSYKFATADYGDVNLFKIITGYSYKSPTKKDDLTFQENTGYPGDEQQEGFIWLNKTYTFSTNSGNNNSIILSIGVWGTWETLRIYYVDEVHVTFEII